MQSPARPAHALLLPLLLLALAPAALAAPKKLPPSMPLCKKADPQLNECLKRSVQASIPDLVKGLDDIALPSVDPFHIQKLYVENGHGSVNLKLTLIDFDIRGMSDAQVESVSMDLTKPYLRGQVTIPRLRLDGQYRVDGKVLVLPITGEGTANITLDNFNYEAELSGDFVEKSGRRYFDVKILAIKTQPGSVSLSLENLFNGNKAMGNQMNEFLNQNWPEIYAELKEPLEQTFAQAMQHIAHRLFAKVPFDDIFLD